LYWGNGFLAGAELNDDMVSINQETVKVFNIHGSFREGAHVFFRNGIYYMSWSIDDTRSPNYSVGYGQMTSPLSDVKVPDNFVILRKDEKSGIFGTGHHSTIQIPGKDEFYVVYHRFNYPKGIKMGDSAGFHREVCIDKLDFNADGSIRAVVPTHKGIVGVK
jgi:arabinoxylan arabinofuranohydrolase